MTREPRAWKTRDEWAKEMRTPYYDRFENLDYDAHLSPHAHPAEIARLKIQLRERWKALGRDMGAVPVGDNDRREDLRWRRSCINRAIKMIEEKDEVWTHPDYCAGAKDLIEPFAARIEAARGKAEAKRHAEIAATPVDDAAWEQELERRRSLLARVPDAYSLDIDPRPAP